MLTRFMYSKESKKNALTIKFPLLLPMNYSNLINIVLNDRPIIMHAFMQQCSTFHFHNFRVIIIFFASKYVPKILFTE